MIGLKHLALAALAFFVLAATLGFLTWSGPGTERSEAANEQAKTQMDLVINGGLCDSSVDAKCTLALGDTFTLSVLPSIIPVGGYSAWQTAIDYGNLLYKPAQNAFEIKWDLGVAPVRGPDQPTGKEGLVVHGDASGAFPVPLPASTQKASLLNLTMNCASNDETPGENFSTAISMIEFNATTLGSLYLLPDGITLNIPNVSSIKINCVAKQPEPGDTDQDGCSDQAENGPNPRLGGQRDYLYFWDFYDVWTHPLGDPQGWERNKVINILDILAVGKRFGSGPLPPAKPQAVLDALTPPVSDSAYHIAYDRGPLVGPDAWDKGPPDGSINIVDDILGVAGQFGHDCT